MMKIDYLRRKKTHRDMHLMVTDISDTFNSNRVFLLHSCLHQSTHPPTVLQIDLQICVDLHNSHSEAVDIHMKCSITVRGHTLPASIQSDSGGFNTIDSLSLNLFLSLSLSSPLSVSLSLPLLLPPSVVHLAPSFDIAPRNLAT